MRRSSALFLSENQPTFPALEPEVFHQITGGFMKTGLTRKQKVTEFYFDDCTARLSSAKDSGTQTFANSYPSAVKHITPYLYVKGFPTFRPTLLMPRNVANLVSISSNVNPWKLVSFENT